MKNQTHTPGPWNHNGATKPNALEPDLNYACAVWNAEGNQFICSGVNKSPLSQDCDKATVNANMRLIAAAPEMLAELVRVTEFLAESHEPEVSHEHNGDDPATCTYCKAIASARAVITKATAS